MRVVAALLLVLEELVEEPDGGVRVVLDPDVTGDPVGLDRAGQRVDLLVHRDRVVVVGELRGEQLALAVPVDADAVVPEDHVLLGVDDPHVLAQVLGAALGDLQVLVLAGQQVGRGHAVDQPGDRVGLLDVAGGLVPAEADLGAVLGEVHRPVAELGPLVEVGQRLDLLDPPAGLLEPVVLGPAAQEHQRLASNLPSRSG